MVVVVHAMVLLGAVVFRIHILLLSAFAVFLSHLLASSGGATRGNHGEQGEKAYREKDFFHVQMRMLTFNKIFAKLRVFSRTEK